MQLQQKTKNKHDLKAELVGNEKHNNNMSKNNHPNHQNSIKKQIKTYFDKNTRKINIQGTTWTSNGAYRGSPGIPNGEQNRHPWPLMLTQGPLKVHF